MIDDVRRAVSCDCENAREKCLPVVAARPVRVFNRSVKKFQPSFGQRFFRAFAGSFRCGCVHRVCHAELRQRRAPGSVGLGKDDTDELAALKAVDDFGDFLLRD